MLKLERNLRVGDHVVYQNYKEAAGAFDGVTLTIGTITLTMEKIATVDEENQMVTFESVDALVQPTYRIRKVNTEDGLAEYPGYDYNAIARDEGEITDETYLAIKKFHQGSSEWTDHGI